MSSIVEKFTLYMCMVNWGNTSTMQQLKQEIIKSMKDEHNSMLDVPEEFIPFIIKEFERKSKVANALIQLIDSFIEEGDD